jgi:hypothetical protein
VKTRRKLMTALAASGVVVLSAGAAQAAGWNASGSGSGVGGATQVNAVANASVSVTAVSSSQLDVTVTAAPTTGPTPAAYLIDEGATPVTGCGAVALNNPCHVTGLTASSTHTFSVFSKLGTNWVSATAASKSGTTLAPPSQTLHISALTGTAERQNKNNFHAAVTITVKDNAGNLVGGVTVTGAFTPTGSSTANTCTTNTTGSVGQCTIASGASDFPNAASETWTVSSLVLTGFTYNAAADVDESISFSCVTATCTVN